MRLIKHASEAGQNMSDSCILAYSMRENLGGLNPFGNLSRYQAKIERTFYRALRELRTIQAGRKSFFAEQYQSQNRTPDGGDPRVEEESTVRQILPENAE